MTPLPLGYVPGDDDVLIGRGKKNLVHTGNLRLRQIVAPKLSTYLQAKSRMDKTAVIMEVIDQVRANSPNGGFLKQNFKTGQYFEVGDFLAREKTAQTFRDALSEHYRSSNPAKKKQRVQTFISNKKSTAMSFGVFSSFVGSSQSTGQQLMSSMNTQLEYGMPTLSRFQSAPMGGCMVDGFQSETSFSHPSFVRNVSDPFPETSQRLDRVGPKKRASSLISRDTLALLSCALADLDVDAMDNQGEDPFEPIPLHMCNHMAI